MASTHDYVEDIRNDNIKIYINGEYYHRSNAKISVFDSGFLLGDGVWEGIRLHDNKLIHLLIGYMMAQNQLQWKYI